MGAGTRGNRDPMSGGSRFGKQEMGEFFGETVDGSEIRLIS